MSIVWKERVGAWQNMVVMHRGYRLHVAWNLDEERWSRSNEVVRLRALPGGPKALRDAASAVALLG